MNAIKATGRIPVRGQEIFIDRAMDVTEGNSTGWLDLGQSQRSPLTEASFRCLFSEGTSEGVKLSQMV